MVKSKKDSHDIQVRAITIEDFPCVLKWSKDYRFCLANGWKIRSSHEELFMDGCSIMWKIVLLILYEWG